MDGDLILAAMTGFIVGACAVWFCWASESIAIAERAPAEHGDQHLDEEV